MHRLSPRPAARGFTLVELMVVMTVVAVLAAVALPSYRSYIAKQRIAAAQADLVALAMNLDGHLLNSTTYPDPASGAALRSALPGWTPVQGADFGYALVSTDNTAFPPAYEVQATGASGMVSGCVLGLSSNGTRTKSNCPGGGSTW